MKASNQAFQCCARCTETLNALAAHSVTGSALSERRISSSWAIRLDALRRREQPLRLAWLQTGLWRWKSWARHRARTRRTSKRYAAWLVLSRPETLLPAHWRRRAAHPLVVCKPLIQDRAIGWHRVPRPTNWLAFNDDVVRERVELEAQTAQFARSALAVIGRREHRSPLAVGCECNGGGEVAWLGGEVDLVSGRTEHKVVH